MSRYAEEVERHKKALLRDPFPYWLGAILLGLLNIALLAFSNHGWGVTTSFAHWGAWIAKAFGAHPETWAFYQSEANAKALAGGFLNDGGSIQNLGIIFGALLATLLASQFRVKKIKSYRQVIAAVLGGLLMGYGARLSYGCNIGALFSGTASMSLHGWVFMIAMFIGAYFGSKLLTKYFM
ncbi:YeeE/YedE family protein [Biomaibacter acetigenes]|uniref:YeeE/YedE family protein n=1 Tax=Biomaibacter acetigenes TaxID=2316383 RepID=A0A3G2R9B6_9FIRM|nr:YeeE/YedE thiosulfate transporter family protein [Biomaibacter acetigenes]AYO32013.1 YeeE/YedE family protein [Biomaibacter acetigenes]